MQHASVIGLHTDESHDDEAHHDHAPGNPHFKWWAARASAHAEEEVHSTENAEDDLNNCPTNKVDLSLIIDGG